VTSTKFEEVNILLCNTSIFLDESLARHFIAHCLCMLLSVTK